MKIFVSLLSFLVGSCACAQAVNYNDVVVIVNHNSPASVNIGYYFQQARNIPSSHIISISGSTNELIDSLEFEQIRAQIESQLAIIQLTDSINYLVTTKGIPLKIESTCAITSNGSCASFDSEIGLILGTYSSSIGVGSSIPNPYYGATQPFSRADYGIYLVTRLDGYTVQDVLNLIDRTGPETPINLATSNAIVDLNLATGGDSAYMMDFYLQPTYDFFTNNAWNAQLDANLNPLLNQTDVAAYIYEGMSVVSNVNLNYTWTEGSIATMSTGKSAITFDTATNSSNNLLLADLISEGCTGAYGHIDNIFFGQMLNAETLVKRYFDPLENYNFAESCFMSEGYLSWQGVAIGDPKSSVVLNDLASIDKPVMDEISMYPNPSTGIVQILANESIISIAVYDMKGAQVINHNQLMSDSFELNLQGVENGIYLVHIEMNGNLIRERIVIQH